MSQLLTICIVNYNSSDFILNSLYCLKKLTKNSYKVIIRDNNSDIKDYLRLKKRIENIPYINLYRVENFKYRGSKAHGIALNDLVKRIDTKFGVILDADFTFLHKHWDEILLNQLNYECPIIGTQAPIHPNNKVLLDFPLMYGLFFNTEIFNKLNIDFRPKDPSKYIDTGYELREKYLTHGYKGKLLLYKNTRTYKAGPFNKLICAEYYLKGYNEIMGCHFGRGSSLGRQKYLKTKYKPFYTLSIFGYIPIGNILIQAKGRTEKNKWIMICRQIVNEFE